MIIDLILDRKDGERYGEPYDAKEFYDKVTEYIRTFPELAVPIARAMDSGTNEDVQTALCNYIDFCDYNESIKDYIRSRTWVED